MCQISEKTIRTLEFDKILAMLADLTCCEDARNAALQLKINTDPETVRKEIQKTADFYTVSTSYGTPTFFYF